MSMSLVAPHMAAAAFLGEDAPADQEHQSVTWEELGLDSRIGKAALRMGLAEPNMVQRESIPLALAGKDILCRAKTGSGKTAAYVMPAIQRVLNAKERDPNYTGVKALLLVPTRELLEQVFQYCRHLTLHCAQNVHVVQLSSDLSPASQKALLAECPDIIVSTPRVVSHLESGVLSIKESLETLVIDEADLILSFGYSEDVRTLLTFTPQIFQVVLMSATLTPDVVQLKQLLLRNAVIIKLEESELHNRQLSQFFVHAEEDEKFLLLYFILKMQLVPGKSIIFVNSIDKCYRLRLFLERFGIRACALNGALPHNSRYHVVQEFNKGTYSCIIATDGAASHFEDAAPGGKKAGKKSSRQGASSGSKTESYGVSRGIDFRDATLVVNFDMADTFVQHTHRVGRTARGNKKGTAITMVSVGEEAQRLEDFQREAKMELTGLTAHSTRRTKRQYKREQALERALLAPASEAGAGSSAEATADGDAAAEAQPRRLVDLDNMEDIMRPLRFDMATVNSFRYRVQDVLRSVTKACVREARLQEIRQELLTSERLRAHFEDNPLDQDALRHDKPLGVSALQHVGRSLRNVPEYLLPTSASVVANGAISTGSMFARDDRAPFDPKRKNKGRRGNKRAGKASKSASSKKRNPLKSFKA
ncbi:hypothetical protein H696_02797 [Fonticula alba]|uniref:RNA helicase n=1 Tax=Fonticula alba TaxID=691883 RepID=A0A058Z876_FONAL|nr:hypothetical protein H696_02797 [Fonticula alba]KCV70455.1 hypothetical protein H696_02797 [Fonticula alba]|eukprot:XP_009494971.1 hypothetical protein H696_02797 [Fonticula alba]